MQDNLPTKLTARDFVYVYEPFLGETYQNCAYMIRPLPYGYSQGYRVYYRGGPMLTMTETFLSAIEACARHEAQRKASAWHDTSTPEGKQYAEELEDAMLTPEAQRKAQEAK